MGIIPEVASGIQTASEPASTTIRTEYIAEAEMINEGTYPDV